MKDLLKIALIFFFIILLTKWKWNLGLTMIASSLLLVLLYRIPPSATLKIVYISLFSFTTINLVLSLTLIRGLEQILKNEGMLEGMMNTLRYFLKGSKFSVAVMPALIGTLPSVGGALFSAPMVEELTKNQGISPHKKSFINYWFRHPWEFILPLYPGIVLASALSKIPLSKFIAMNFPCALIMVFAGALLGLRNFKHLKNERNFLPQIESFTPLLLLFILVIAFHLELLYSLIITISLLFIFFRYSPEKIYTIFRNSLSLDVILLIPGIIIFKTALEMSGAVKNLSLFFKESGIPLFPVFFFLPFITGILTGFTVGFVGSTFPFLLSMVPENGNHYITFAFCSGYCGVLLSPVHLCLILTKEYFNAEMRKIYKRLIPGVVLVLLTGLAVFLIHLIKNISLPRW